MNQSASTRSRVAGMIARLLLALLLGMMVAIGFLATPAVFELRAELGLSSADAGTLAGAMLHPLDFTTLAVVLLLLGLEGLRGGAATSRRAVIAYRTLLVVMLACTLAELLVVSPMIRDMREIIRLDYGGMESAPDDVRGRFGMLHGVSMIRALAVMLCGLAAWFVDESSRRPGN
jgi:hypothetical protein